MAAEVKIEDCDPDPEQDVESLLPRVVAPTLVTCGTADRASSVDDARALAPGIRDPRVYQFEGRMHVPAITATEEFGKVLRRFVRQGALDALGHVGASRGNPAEP